MNSFSPEEFFDLSHSPIRTLFDRRTFVWDVLSEIGPFLKSLPLGQVLGQVDSRAYLVNEENVYIAEGAIVEPGAYVRGPAFIGKGAVVRHGAYLRGNVYLDEGAVVGHDTEVKNALFLKGAKAAHFAYVGDSILGAEVNLGGGTICANLRFDRKPILVRHNARVFETGLRKFGAIIGDHGQTGCHTVLNPGTLFGKGVICFPNQTLKGVFPGGVTIRPEKEGVSLCH